jgi:hypothetical protein
MGALIRDILGALSDLAVIARHDGRQLLVCVDVHGELHRLNPISGHPTGPVISIPHFAILLATDLDTEGRPSAIVGNYEQTEALHVERWWLDTGTVDTQTPPTLRAIYRHATSATLVLAGADGTITITPEAERETEQPPQPSQDQLTLW